MERRVDELANAVDVLKAGSEWSESDKVRALAFRLTVQVGWEVKYGGVFFFDGTWAKVTTLTDNGVVVYTSEGTKVVKWEDIADARRPEAK